MTGNWLTGSAAAILLIASPAFAQSTYEACQVESLGGDEMFAALDTDADEKLSEAEYVACLDANGVKLSDDERAAYEALFDEIDDNGDAFLELAEVSSAADDSGPDAAAADTLPTETLVEVLQRSATVTVTVPPPTITVIQRPPRIIVRQRDPIVEVDQKYPEITVNQPKPDVRVEQPEPEIEVQLQDPEIRIEQPDPQVQIAQVDPEVNVTQAPPRISVETQEPLVSVDQPEPTVSVSQAEAAVSVQVEEPEVTIEQAEPNVAVERVATIDPNTVAAAATAPGETAAATTVRIPVADIEGKDVYNTNGEVIGQVDDVALDPESNTPHLVVSIGGVFGLGDRDVPFPYSDFEISDERIVLNTPLTADTLEEMPTAEDRKLVELPEEMIER